ncbi:MAG: isoprenoid biosynthesis glyoxalase ElbB [Bacteroidales bacterium]|jgi:enhancing lycopene biosynthesis protein 2|nr:isoprenoid biosynthesis glyoxalase ElbB [Bacteroidales bacterium]
MKKFAVILAGCGNKDGAEIGESLTTLLSIDQCGVSYDIFAPDKQVFHTLNYITGEEIPDRRNVMLEAARIARGDIRPLSEYAAANYDALVLPGGFGAAKNLCDYAIKGAEMTVDKEVEKAVLDTHTLGKPIGALCIAPVIIAKLIPNANVTSGNDPDTIKNMLEMGARHTPTQAGEYVYDAENNLYSTPCYMLPNARISEVYSGVFNMIKAMVASILP